MRVGWIEDGMAPTLGLEEVDDHGGEGEGAPEGVLDGAPLASYDLRHLPWWCGVVWCFVVVFVVMLLLFCCGGVLLLCCCYYVVVEVATIEIVMFL